MTVGISGISVHFPLLTDGQRTDRYPSPIHPVEVLRPERVGQLRRCQFSARRDGRSAGPDHRVSSSTRRHWPHGISRLPSPSTHTSATSRRHHRRPGHTQHLGAQTRPHETFSTLQPANDRLSSTSAAAPTRNPEHGAYALARTSIALSRNAFQSISAPIHQTLSVLLPLPGSFRARQWV